jgi:hypothetical protein
MMGGVSEAVRTGDRVKVLKALQALLAEKIEQSKGVNAAQLALQLRMVTTELADIAPQKEKSVVDEIARRRAARKSKAASS